MNEITVCGQITSALEIIAMGTGIAGVWLTAKQSIFCFPVGIINVTLYAFIFFQPEVRLYADGLLQCIYIILLAYGWLRWTNKTGNTETMVPKRTTMATVVMLIIVTLISTCILALVLSNFTNASYPWLDSLLTSASLVSQWMIAKKFIENWIVWIVVDIIYIPLYINKQLPLTAVLYFIFLILAAKGYYEWKKNIIKNHAG